MHTDNEQVRYGNLIHDLVSRIQFDHPDILERLHSTMHHPRSLARPMATWRPPTITLPDPSRDTNLCTTLTRRRVGPQAVHFMAEYNAHAPAPAYVISMRITRPTGATLPRRFCEAWVRAFVGETAQDCIHYVEERRSMTFFWLVDAHFRPLPSPAAMFSDAPLAA